jgi:hypothetical protein
MKVGDHSEGRFMVVARQHWLTDRMDNMNWTQKSVDTCKALSSNPSTAKKRLAMFSEKFHVNKGETSFRTNLE